MARNWTDAQKDALRTRDRTLLVSAAAGSGKTAVLTERIIQSLLDTKNPIDLSRILVVTFTVAATSELRARIASTLSDAIANDPNNAHLNRQLMLLGSAHISTIDSFYLNLVRNHFQSAGFPPTFRMADESELLSLRREIMNDTIDKMYTDYPDFSLISDIFCDLRTETALTEILLSLAEKLRKLPQSIDILLQSADEMEGGKNTPLDTVWGKTYLKEITLLATEGRDLFSYALTLYGDISPENKAAQKYVPLYSEIESRCEQLLTAIAQRDYPAICEIASSSFSKRLGGQRGVVLSAEQEAVNELCEHYRKTVWADHVKPLGLFSAEEIAQSATETAKALRLLHETLKRYLDEYTAIKLQRGVAEFTDVSRAAYRLLVDAKGNPTPLAREISGNYDAIYIDEYQDTDAMQDATFRAISTPRNRFMVGDIKQSIYMFRGAQPAIFAGYRKRFPAFAEGSDDAEGSIFMSDCFRCDNNIIRFSNAVSGFLFSNNAESIGYTEKDDLHFAKNPPDDPDYTPPPCKVIAIERPPKGTVQDDEEERAEARLVAHEIYRLLCDGKRSDGTPIRPSHIAVLMRGGKHATPIARALAAYGIPSNDTSKCNFFESPEVLCMYSLLAALDNPFRDVPFAAALRSPFFCFTLEDLVRLRNHGDRSLSLYECLLAFDPGKEDAALSAKVAYTKDRLDLFRRKACTLPVDKLLRYLYRETGVLSFSGYEKNTEGDKKSRRANLRRLYEYARSFEASGFKGLYQFVNYIDDVMANDTKVDANEGTKDAVTLVTIHHSKGLEYPVCFLVGTGSRFNDEDTKSTMLFSETMGCAMRLPNAGPFSRTNTFFRQSIVMDVARQQREEEMRVLYVAMTRARERLYVTGTPLSSAQKMVDAARGAAYLPRQLYKEHGNCYLDWILTALCHTDHEEFASIEVQKSEEIAPLPSTPLYSPVRVDATGEQTSVQSDPEVVEELQKRFAFVYPFEHLTRLPAKLSVSRLSPEALDVFDNDNAPSPDMLFSVDTERLLHSFERTPTFGKKEADAAARGTATHEFLQFCRFERAEKTGVAAELERLIAERFLPAEYRDAVWIDELESFFKSPFYASLSTATELHRETRFHIFLPAATFTADPAFAAELGDEKLPIQGVIDLFFTDAEGRLILCDYKTDRLTPAECRNPALAAQKLSARHGQQLAYYALALEKLCGKRPDRILIYSLPLGDAVEAILPQI